MRPSVRLRAKDRFTLQVDAAAFKRKQETCADAYMFKKINVCEKLKRGMYRWQSVSARRGMWGCWDLMKLVAIDAALVIYMMAAWFVDVYSSYIRWCNDTCISDWVIASDKSLRPYKRSADPADDDELPFWELRCVTRARCYNMSCRPIYCSRALRHRRRSIISEL